MSNELEITKIEELSKDVLYHVNLPATTHPSVITSFVNAAKLRDLKLFITLGDTVFERMVDVFAKLPEEQKQVINDLLKPKESLIKNIEFDDYSKNGDLKEWEVDPRQHEQSK